MKFGPVKIDRALGAVLAHSIAGVKKGRVLTASDIEALRRQGIAEVIAAQLSENDVSENEAAAAIAKAICGAGVKSQSAFTGRANLYAKAAGLIVVDEVALNKANSVHEAITIACLKSYGVVETQQMLATVKIIPYAVPRKTLEKVLHILGKRKLLQVADFQPQQMGLIITKTAATKLSLISKSERAIRDRLMRVGSVLSDVVLCSHQTEEIKQAISQQKRKGLSAILILGASAIVDRADVVPEALKQAGGRVLHLGMPVDPGNLLMLGTLDTTPVIGVPTCARSSKENGFDWIINRLCAGLNVKPEDIMAMGAGGLLAEISTRPQPRSVA